jgi:hypothetical protein
MALVKTYKRLNFPRDFSHEVACAYLRSFSFSLRFRSCSLRLKRSAQDPGMSSALRQTHGVMNRSILHREPGATLRPAADRLGLSHGSGKEPDLELPPRKSDKAIDESFKKRGLEK